MQGSGMGEGGGSAPRARRQAGRAYALPPAVPRARRTRMPWRSSKANVYAEAGAPGSVLVVEGGNRAERGRGDRHAL
eukprot:4940215-Prymnesium_polylepis.1